MDFLRSRPFVAVVNDEYQIVVITKDNGLISAIVDGKRYYPDNDGVLSSEKNYAKINIPQAVLNGAESYTVAFAKTVERNGYFSQFESEVYADFSFKPIKKAEGINVYHIADVHLRFDIAKNTADYFGDEVDLFIVNGDVGEIEKTEDFFDSCNFIGEISRSEIPVLVVRGNHDVRGKVAENYADFFPTYNGKTYFEFSVGNIGGVVFDCGENKPDDHAEYGGVKTEKGGFISTNAFSGYRKKQTEFLQGVKPDKNKINIAIGHICPVQTTIVPGCIFDIEREEYSKWNKVFNDGFDFMICGHIHVAYVIGKGDDAVTSFHHDYPVIVGSAVTFGSNDISGLKEKFSSFTESVTGLGTNGVEKNALIGTALVLYKDFAKVLFTDQNKKVVFATEIKY